MVSSTYEGVVTPNVPGQVEIIMSPALANGTGVASAATPRPPPRRRQAVGLAAPRQLAITNETAHGGVYTTTVATGFEEQPR